MNKLNKDEITMLKIAVATVLSTLILFFIIHPYANRQTVQNEEQTTINSDGEEIKKPIFTYYVTSADLKDKEIKACLERLTEEYGTRVVFEIKNVSENRKLLDEYPVKDRTPALIMQDRNGNVSDILFKTAEYKNLKESLERVLEN
ncbi:MAG: hypothetical protein PUB42_05665 [Firmicutes bacterium]|nr:hypothetical protein [Bacillota bacterium]